MVRNGQPIGQLNERAQKGLAPLKLGQARRIRTGVHGCDALDAVIVDAVERPLKAARRIAPQRGPLALAGDVLK